MKTFNYNFHGNVTVILDDTNRMLELVQTGSGYTIRLAGDNLTVHTREGVFEYPNNIQGFRQAYQKCGFQVHFFHEPHSDRLVISDGVSTKEMIYDNINHNFIAILEQGTKRVLLSTGSAGWNCTATINGQVDIKRGNQFELNECPLWYAMQLQKVFNPNSYY